MNFLLLPPASFVLFQSAIKDKEHLSQKEIDDKLGLGWGQP